MLRKHYNTTHTTVRRARGDRKGSGSAAIRSKLNREYFNERTAWSPVHFQRILATGCGSAGSRVTRPTEYMAAVAAEGQLRPNSIAGQVWDTLAILEQSKLRSRPLISNAPAKSQVSPRLERTRWTRYFDVRCFSDVAQLARLRGSNKPVLCKLSKSINRLVEVAYRSGCEDRTNFSA